MNRIHKRTMTEEERAKNEELLDELTDRYIGADSKDNREEYRILEEKSDLGDTEATCQLINTISHFSAFSDVVECGAEIMGKEHPERKEVYNTKQLNEFRKRGIFQLKVECDREPVTPDKENSFWNIYEYLRALKRNEEAVAWLNRALRFGGFVNANGDKELLRELLRGNWSDEIEERFNERQNAFIERSMKEMCEEIEEMFREDKTTELSILVCGPGRTDCDDLVECVMKPDDDSYVDESAPENEGSAGNLICKTVYYMRAHFVETKTVFGSDPELAVPPGKTMKEFVRDVERERHCCEMEDDSELSWSDRIDAVWYVTNGDVESMDAQEREFIRSLMELPNAMLVVNLSCTVVSREHLMDAIDGLTALVAPDRIVLVDSGYYGQSIDAKWKLIETTKQKHRESEVFTSDEEKQYLENAWGDYFGALLEKWHARSERNVERCIRHAAGRARFIVEQEEDVSFSDLLEEGRSLLKDLFNLVTGGSDKSGDEPELKKDVSHTAELLRNITIMIYELGGCLGCAAVKDDVTAILTACKASDLPEDAAAITYAVGMTAKAYFESGKMLPRPELKDVFAKAKEEGLQLDFEPMHEDDPATSFLFDDDEDDEDELDDAGANDDENDFDDDDYDDDDDDGDDDDFGDDDGDDDDGDDGGGKTCLIGSLCKMVKLDNADLNRFSIGNEDDPDAVGYGGESVAAAIGDDPEIPDNASGKQLRLPADYPAPREALKTDGVSGGWGYTKRDAAVVGGGIPGEHAFIEARTDEELRRLEKTTGDKFVFADYDKYAQELVNDGDDFYDLLYVQIALIPEADWNQLKADWESHDGYKNDRKGRRQHEKWRERRTIRFTEHFWFNVNSMFHFLDEDWEKDDPDGDE